MWVKKYKCADVCGDGVLFLCGATPRVSNLMQRMHLSSSAAQRRVLTNDARLRTQSSCDLTIRAAALSRHHNDQLGYMLSRVAASAALSDVRNEPIVFTGSRDLAREKCGMQLTLSHEDLLSAAMIVPLTQSNRTYSTTRSAMASKVVACASHADTPLRVAVDVVDVSHMYRARQKFSQLSNRMFRHCNLSVHGSRKTNKAQHGFSTENNTLDRPVTLPGADTFSPPTLLQALRDIASWNDSENTCDEHNDSFLYKMVQSVTLAQHWSVRECCVKLLGISQRAFDYTCVGCFASTLNNCSVTPCAGNAAKTVRLNSLQPHITYTCKISGDEARMFEKGQMQPCITLRTWLEWLSGSDNNEVWPHVVTISSCPVLPT